MSKTDCHKKPNKKNRENPPDISDICTVLCILIQIEEKTKKNRIYKIITLNKIHQFICKYNTANNNSLIFITENRQNQQYYDTPTKYRKSHPKERKICF